MSADVRSSQVSAFVHDLRFADLPSHVVAQARRCLLDLVGVAAAGSTTALSRIVRDHAARYLRGTDRTARLLFDGRAVSPIGAAVANAATIDAMDGHDGHRLTKGHAGAALLPAAVAVLEGNPAATVDDLLVALVVGYEIATRAGITLHATAADYHSSGAWNALGAAAVAARGLGLDRTATEHAIGIAEYHGPRAPMMSCIDYPSMVKDSSGWGANAGVSAALLAESGFTGPPAELLTADPACWEDLGRRWRLLEQYFKPYPVCRWAHPAVEGVLQILGDVDVDPYDIYRIEVTTFAAAARLASGFPENTEVAQYSLSFPVALAAVHGAVPPDGIAGPERAGDLVRRLVSDTTVYESAELTAAFPETRSAEVTMALRNGSALRSGRITATGDPEQPMSTAASTAKFRSFVGPVLGSEGTMRLLAWLESGQNGLLHELLDEIATVR